MIINNNNWNQFITVVLGYSFDDCGIFHTLTADYRLSKTKCLKKINWYLM